MKHFSLIFGFAVLLTAFTPMPGARAAEYKKAYAYDESSSVSLKKCFSKSFFGQKIKKCINAGKIGGGVNGSVSLVSFANEDSGEIGAALVIQQDFVVILFGKKVKVGAICGFNSARSSSYAVVLGVTLKTPDVPGFSVVDLVSRNLRSVVTAKTGPMAGVRGNVRASRGKISSGYAGAVSNANFKKLMSSAANGCTLKIPNYEIFCGIKGVNLFKAGVEFKIAAGSWKVDPTTADASVTLKTTATAVAKVGGEKISFKVLGKGVSWKLPGFAVKKHTTLLNQKLSI